MTVYGNGGLPSEKQQKYIAEVDWDRVQFEDTGDYRTNGGVPEYMFPRLISMTPGAHAKHQFDVDADESQTAFIKHAIFTGKRVFAKYVNAHACAPGWEYHVLTNDLTKVVATFQHHFIVGSDDDVRKEKDCFKTYELKFMGDDVVEFYTDYYDI